MDTQKYFGGFDGAASVNANFNGERWSRGEQQQPEELVKDAEILFASYSQEAYSGKAFVIFERDGKLFEVHGSHCSCYGLEGQWNPEETTWDAIALRPWVCDADKNLHGVAFFYYDSFAGEEVARALVKANATPVAPNV